MALPARPYDPIYDTTYTVSGPKDHYRQQTAAGGFMIERAPEYPNMFSELPHFPATTFRLKNSDKIPGFVDRGFHAEQRDAVDMTFRSQPDRVAGTDRYKYFRKPLLAAGISHGVLIKHAVVLPVPTPTPPPPEPKSKTIGTQSDYRESEAQTMPYEPDVILPDTANAQQQYLSARHHCEGPELLQLKDMHFGDGLPPGLQEVIRVEKMRAKRAFEATLPPIHDMEQLPLRQKMIEEWEAKEWVEREQEILSVQDERLMLIDQALQAREEEIDQTTARRIEDRKQTMLENRATQFATIQASRIKTMRQLIESRKYTEKHRKQVKPTIVEKYANFGSATYAPVQREGKFPEQQPHLIETEGFQPATLQGISELEAFLPKKLMTMTLKDPAASGRSDYKQRQEAGIQKDLKAVSDLLDASRTTKGVGFGDCWPAPLKDTEGGLVSTVGASAATLRAAAAAAASSAHKKPEVRAVERPDTPELAPPATMSAGHERDAAAMLLQRLIRGRAVQNRMYEGKMRRLDLIRELQLETSGQVPTTRPEDLHPDMIRLDALIGQLASQLAVALSGHSSNERARLVAETNAWIKSLPNFDSNMGAFADGQQHLSCKDTQLHPALLAAVAGHLPAAEQTTISEVQPDNIDEEASRANDNAEDAGVQRDVCDANVADSGDADAAEDAETRIQAAFRGHRARLQVAAMQHEQNDPNTPPQQDNSAMGAEQMAADVEMQATQEHVQQSSEAVDDSQQEAPADLLLPQQGDDSVEQTAEQQGSDLSSQVGQEVCEDNAAPALQEGSKAVDESMPTSDDGNQQTGDNSETADVQMPSVDASIEIEANADGIQADISASTDNKHQQHETSEGVTDTPDIPAPEQTTSAEQQQENSYASEETDRNGAGLHTEATLGHLGQDVGSEASAAAEDSTSQLAAEATLGTVMRADEQAAEEQEGSDEQ